MKEQHGRMAALIIQVSSLAFITGLNTHGEEGSNDSLQLKFSAGSRAVSGASAPSQPAHPHIRTLVHEPCHSAPSHAQTAKRAVAATLAPSLPGIKRRETSPISLATPPTSPWAGLSSSLPNKRTAERSTSRMMIMLATLI